MAVEEVSDDILARQVLQPQRSQPIGGMAEHLTLRSTLSSKASVLAAVEVVLTLGGALQERDYVEEATPARVECNLHLLPAHIVPTQREAANGKVFLPAAVGQSAAGHFSHDTGCEEGRGPTGAVPSHHRWCWGWWGRR